MLSDYLKDISTYSVSDLDGILSLSEGFINKAFGSGLD